MTLYVMPIGRNFQILQKKAVVCFDMRSQHYSCLAMHMFDEGYQLGTIISHRTSIASVLKHRHYNPDHEIRMLFRSFQPACPAKRHLMPH